MNTFQSYNFFVDAIIHVSCSNLMNFTVDQHVVQAKLQRADSGL